VLMHGTTKPSKEQIKLIREQMKVIRSMRSACLPDPVCTKLLKRAESLFRRLEARANNGSHRGNGNKKHRPHKDSTGRSGGGERDHESRRGDHGRGHKHGRHKSRDGEHGTHRRHHKHGKNHDGHTGHRGKRHLPVR
jgi:hypothetical protein